MSNKNRSARQCVKTDVVRDQDQDLKVQNQDQNRRFQYYIRPKYAPLKKEKKTKTPTNAVSRPRSRPTFHVTENIALVKFTLYRQISPIVMFRLPHTLYHHDNTLPVDTHIFITYLLYKLYCM